MPEHLSVISAVEDGFSIPSWIAEVTGLHVSTVRKRLNQYEAEGRMVRQQGNGTVECPDLWELAPTSREEPS